MNVAIILAGGIGVRVGSDVPKQFIKIYDIPVIAYTLDIFQNNLNIDEIEIVCKEEYIEYVKEIIKKYNFDKVKFVIKGGNDFQHSVLNGVNNLKGKISKDDNVVIHFAASPFVTNEIIDDTINVCNKKGNAISTTSFYILSGLKDTPEMSTTYIDRETIACMNSPHTFKFGVISEIYDKAIESNVINEVEPHTTTLMYKMKIPIYFAKGSQTNIKITNKEDLNLFKGYVCVNKEKYRNLF